MKLKSSFVKYVLTGIYSKGIGLFLLHLCIINGIYQTVSAMISFVISFILVVSLNSKWVFNVPLTSKRFFTSFIIMLFSLLIYSITFHSLFILEIHYIGASIISSMLLYPLHYSINRSFVYSP